MVEFNAFQFRVNLNSKLLNQKRHSVESSIFEPMERVSALILLGKKMLRGFCMGKVEWDEPVPDHIKPLWGKMEK